MRASARKKWAVPGLIVGGLVVSGWAVQAPLVAQDAGQDGPGEPTTIPDIGAIMAQFAGAQQKQGKKKDEFRPYKEVIEGYEKVVSTTDGRSLYTLWTRKKDGQMLAELPRGFANQKLFWAYTIASGITTSGVQFGDQYVYWKRYDKRLALIHPSLDVRTSGDSESKAGVKRVHTDRVLLDVPILTMSPGGGPVIDLDALLIGQGSKFFGGILRGAKTNLLTIAKAKAFPENIEVAYQLPLAGGNLGTLAYSIRVIPKSTGYKPREADPRIGFFTTSYMDAGKTGEYDEAVRYINRWKLQKRDPRLKMSPPKEPIVFYLEHTIPVRYRRWVRDGILEWNKAFEKVGIVNAIEVYQQDAQSGAHMDKDPEDARYNFLLWTNAGMGFAIGPSRVDPNTGQILDADIVMDEGFINSWARQYRELLPEIAMEGFAPETLEWLERHPNWDPRVRLAAPADREQVIAKIQHARRDRIARHKGIHPEAEADVALLGDNEYDGLGGRISQVNGRCSAGRMMGYEIALFRLMGDVIRDDIVNRQADDDGDDDIDVDDIPLPDNLPEEMKAMIRAKLAELKASGKLKDMAEMMGKMNPAQHDEGDEDDQGEGKPKKDDKEELLDGLPESFVGPLIKDVVMHEVGHTLGLRHNFKASTAYTLAQINDEAWKGKAQTGSVMDYNPLNINYENGPEQGDYTMTTIGPYDYWAIQYGYTFDKDLSKITARVAEPELAYATDEDTWGPDPRARRFDFGADPLNHAETMIRLVDHLRSRLIDRVVKKGDTFQKIWDGYNLLLGRQAGAVSVAANWVGETYIHRDRVGDPSGRDPVANIPADKQRRALKFVIDNTFYDKAFGLTPELLSKMTLDKWWDAASFRSIFDDPEYPIHDRIMGIQASALTQLMNPTTLRRVYDNEFRAADSEDALTLPEIINTITDSAFSELDKGPNGNYTARKPMISSLRRDLQREVMERLIDLTLPTAQMGAASKPIANLSTFKLRQIKDKIDRVLASGNADNLDPYSMAHLSESSVRIGKALDAIYIYNTDDIAPNLSLPLSVFLGKTDN